VQRVVEDHRERHEDEDPERRAAGLALRVYVEKIEQGLRARVGLVRIRGDVGRRLLLLCERRYLAHRGHRDVLRRRQRAERRQVDRDRPHAGLLPRLLRLAELEHRHADEQLVSEREMRRRVDLVAVDERPVLRVEILDLRAVLDRCDLRVMARDQLVLQERDTRTRVAPKLGRAVQRDQPARLGPLDDLEDVVVHVPFPSTALVLGDNRT
jgi:hypothetical protein